MTSTPTGLLLAAGELSADHIAEALHDQGGPSWDKTVFRLLTGVDVAALAAGTPKAGGGTAVSLASSGWWLRNLDDVAQRLAAKAGQSVLAVFECPGPIVSGWHLAHPDGTSERRVSLDEAGQWGAGVVRLTDGEAFTAGSLEAAAHQVHGDDPKGSALPGLFCLTADPERPEEWAALLEVRGAALTGGIRWRPGTGRDPADEPPAQMRVVLLQSNVRLPGPPRWARAVRAVAIRTAEEAARSDGWICLAPETDEELTYATAIRVLQLAPLTDGSAMGVLHPRCAVKVEEIEDGTASVEVVPQEESTSEAIAEGLSLVMARLRTSRPELELSASTLSQHPDPASMIAWRLELNPTTAQDYLAASSPAARLRVLSDSLTR